MLMNKPNPYILVTGRADYVGSHVVTVLHKQGHGVVILDNLVYSHRDIVEEILQDKPVGEDICDSKNIVGQIFLGIDAVYDMAINSSQAKNNRKLLVSVEDTAHAS